MRRRFYVTVIEVEGPGGFPLDMLRLDDCVPANESDIMTIMDAGLRASHLSPGDSLWRRVRLHRYSLDGGPAHPGEWAEFGWQVVTDTGASR